MSAKEVVEREFVFAIIIDLSISDNSNEGIRKKLQE